MHNGNFSLPSFILRLSDELKKDHKLYLMGFSKAIWSYTRDEKKWVSLGHTRRKIPFILCTIVLLAKALNKQPLSAFGNLIYLLKNHLNRNSISQFNLLNALLIIQPDVIHIQWASHLKLFRPLLDLQQNKRPKVIVSLRGRLVNVSPNTDPGIARLYKEYFPKVDGFHAVSRAIAEEAQRWGAAAEKIRVVYSGLDLQKIQAYQKRDWRLGHPHQILSVGRIHWLKGYHYALDAIALLRQKGISIQYTIIAPGDSTELLYQIKGLGLQEQVKIIPGLPQEKVFAAMANADLLLLPSVMEGIANVVLEAMAIGLPIVSSDCGGMAEVVEDGVNGLLFRNRDVNNMASQLEVMINLNPEQRKLMAQAAQRTIQQQHSLDRLGLEMSRLYESVLCASD